MMDDQKPFLPSSRWRGFNLLDLFSTSNRWDEHFPMSHGPFKEDHFRWIAGWGFNFVRIPMSYLYFIADAGRSAWSLERLAWIDSAVEYGDKHGVHVSLNFHRAPGFCVTSYPFDHPEPDDLFHDAKPLQLFGDLWATLANRYKGIDSQKLSFDLLNETPLDGPDVSHADVWRMYEHVIGRIRAIDPQRFILVEGTNYGITVMPRDWLVDTHVGASAHWYSPAEVSHHDCPWFSGKNLPVPTWPYVFEPGRSSFGFSALPDRRVWDKGLLRELLQPWFDLSASGTLVHFGETGSYRNTPHKVFLAWQEDLLSLLKEHHIGWALWNFAGPFGVLDTERSDIAYENFNGHQLDSKYLELLQAN